MLLTITPQQRIERSLTACEDAAAAEGLTATKARQCEEGQHSCRACPWRRSAARWSDARAQQRAAAAVDQAPAKTRRAA